jgi:hypothetical protein
MNKEDSDSNDDWTYSPFIINHNHELNSIEARLDLVDSWTHQKRAKVLSASGLYKIMPQCERYKFQAKKARWVSIFVQKKLCTDIIHPKNLKF